MSKIYNVVIHSKLHVTCLTERQYNNKYCIQKTSNEFHVFLCWVDATGLVIRWVFNFSLWLLSRFPFLLYFCLIEKYTPLSIFFLKIWKIWISFAHIWINNAVTKVEWIISLLVYQNKNPQVLFRMVLPNQNVLVYIFLNIVVIASDSK